MYDTSDCIDPAFQHDNSGTNGICAAPKIQYAITVRHAQIQYKDVLHAVVSGGAPTTNVVLKDFNMSVEKGHIYGLLGASGCGKTSILRAIVGQIELTAGEIRVLGHKPKTPQSGIPGTTIGYMPQGLCLMGEFTIKELLYFYGQLAGMTSKEIDEKCDYFVKLLELPKESRLVETLSGGQRRRVSFAIALMHSPPVLILDEPTVGVDPLLRESIWKYLTKLVKTNGTTVLITTHYLEEASNTDTVGLMRNGKLMAEQSPKSLMESLQCNGLEEVLVKLCVLQSTKEHPISSINETVGLPALPMVDEGIKSLETNTWVKKDVSPIRRIRVLAWKNVISFTRHYWFIFILHLFPAICVSIFTSSFGRTPQELKVSVFNQEANCFSGGLIMPNSYGYGNSTDCEMPSFLSCKILQLLRDRGVLPVFSESESTANYDVKKGRTWAVLSFPKNFSSALVQRARGSPLHVTDEVINMGLVQVTMDQSDRVVSFLLQQQIYESYKQMLQDVTTVCNTFRHMKELPIQYKNPIYGSKLSMSDTSVPGIITSLSLMVPLTATLSSLLPEKIAGTLERGLVSGITMTEVILSHFVVCLVPSCTVMLLLVVIPYGFFGLVINGSYCSIAVVLLPLAVSGMIVGFILALLCRSFTAASNIGSGFYFTCVFSSGTIWPVEGIFPYLKEVCWMLPMTLPTEAIRHIAIRGWSLYNKSVQIALTSTLMWCCIFSTVLLLMLRLRR